MRCKLGIPCDVARAPHRQRPRLRPTVRPDALYTLLRRATVLFWRCTVSVTAAPASTAPRCGDPYVYVRTTPTPIISCRSGTFALTISAIAVTVAIIGVYTEVGVVSASVSRLTGRGRGQVRHSRGS